jgi:hypothetical protein
MASDHVVITAEVRGAHKSYALTCLPDRQQQASRLEALRYKWGGYRTMTGVMQRLGDIGRALFPWLAGVRWF